MELILNQLMILSGNNVPLPQLQLDVHVPTIKQIAYIGQTALYSGIQILSFSKDRLGPQDRKNLQKYTDFDIIMAILEDKTQESKLHRQYALAVLTLLFPDCEISFEKHQIVLEKNEKKHYFNNICLQSFKKIISSIFNLSSRGNQQYKPTGQMANKIAEKIRQGRAKKAKERGGQQQPSILSRYVSILAVGQNKDFNQLMNYTVCQLYDEFQRFQLKINYDLWVQQKMAGAKNVKQAQNWMKDLHNQKDGLLEAAKSSNKSGR